MICSIASIQNLSFDQAAPVQWWIAEILGRISTNRQPMNALHFWLVVKEFVQKQNQYDVLTLKHLKHHVVRNIIHHIMY